MGKLKVELKLILRGEEVVTEEGGVTVFRGTVHPQVRAELSDAPRTYAALNLTSQEFALAFRGETWEMVIPEGELRGAIREVKTLLREQAEVNRRRRGTPWEN